MTRETAAAKGRRYLTEGRLVVIRVQLDEVRAACRGDAGQVYHCGHSAGSGWYCGCPARTDQCAHLTALRLVTVRRPPPQPVAAAASPPRTPGSLRLATPTRRTA